MNGCRSQRSPTGGHDFLQQSLVRSLVFSVKLSFHDLQETEDDDGSSLLVQGGHPNSSTLNDSIARSVSVNSAQGIDRNSDFLPLFMIEVTEIVKSALDAVCLEYFQHRIRGILGMNSIEDECQPFLELLMPKSWNSDDWESVCSELRDSDNVPLERDAFTTLRRLLTTPVDEFTSLLTNAGFVSFIENLTRFSISEENKLLLSRIVALVGFQPVGDPTEVESLECPLIDNQVILHLTPGKSLCI